MKFIEVGTFQDSVKAHILRSKLEDAGIPAYIFGSNRNYSPDGGMLREGVRLVVNDFDREETMTILGVEQLPIYDGEDKTVYPCPHCGSSYTRVQPLSIKRPWQLLYTVFMLIAGIIFRSPNMFHACDSCGREFKTQG